MLPDRTAVRRRGRASQGPRLTGINEETRYLLVYRAFTLFIGVNLTRWTIHEVARRIRCDRGVNANQHSTAGHSVGAGGECVAWVGVVDDRDIKLSGAV